MNIIFFLFISALIGIILHISISHDQSRLLIFGCTVFVGSILFPRIRSPLDGSKVDLLYYGSAISAAILFFIATETDLKRIQLEENINISENERDSIKGRIEITNQEIENRKSSLQYTLDDISRYKIEKKHKDIFDDNEVDISKKLYEMLELYAVKSDLREKYENCRKLSEEFMKRKRAEFYENVSRPRRKWSDTWVNPEHMACTVQFRSIIEGLGNYSFKKIRSLLKFKKRDSDLNEKNEKSYSDMFIDIAGQKFTVAYVLQIIETFSKSILFYYNSDLVSLAERRNNLNNIIQNKEKDLNLDFNELKMIGDKINSYNELLKSLNQEPLRGFALTVSKWLAFTWPYVLIFLLGLKIARKDYFEKKPNGS